MQVHFQITESSEWYFFLNIYTLGLKSYSAVIPKRRRLGPILPAVKGQKRQISFPSNVADEPPEASKQTKKI